jgi:murein DD-endopeptidase MepM/ murein hydrolase activator NlpD
LKGEHGTVLLDLNIDEHELISGLSVSPLPVEPPVAKNDIPIALPFRGQWDVHWGGDISELNMHVRGPVGKPWSQRRAADILIVGDNGRTHKAEGKLNTDYYAYGKEILAVADGEVTTVIDGVPENEPGTKNPTYLAGNMVMIRHAPNLYSMYAHLQPGKTTVKVGAKVKRGNVLGLCGNSGNASEPHLHFQLEDGPRFESSWGVLPVFTGVMVSRGGTPQRSDAYELTKRDTIEPAPR